MFRHSFTNLSEQVYSTCSRELVVVLSPQHSSEPNTLSLAAADSSPFDGHAEQVWRRSHEDAEAQFSFLYKIKGRCSDSDNVSEK